MEMDFFTFFLNNEKNFDAVLFDIDGTLSSGGTVLPGAKEFLEYLKEKNFPYLFVTNDSCNSVEQKAAKSCSYGLPTDPEKILSAGNSLKMWAERHYHGETFFTYGKLGIPSYADLAGIITTADPERIDECKGVIAGEGYYEWQTPLEAVFNLFLKHPEYPYVVANPDSYWPSARKRGWGIGAGGIARFICQILKDSGKDVTPTYLGKPYPYIYKCACSYLKNQYPDREFNDMKKIIMLGDSLTSDIAGANAEGMTSALVLTGITTREMAETASAENKPKLIFKNISGC